MGAGAYRLSRRGRTRAGLVLGVVAATVGLGVVQMWPAVAAGSPSRPLDRDIHSYVLFAFNKLSFKGGQTTGRGVISGGDVGANGLDANNPDLTICQNASVKMDTGSQIAASTMAITSKCSVWDLFANRLTVGSNVVAQNSGPNSFTTPILSPPPFPSFSCGATPITVDTGRTKTLAPGTYGTVVFKDDSTVTLQAVVYTMCSLGIGKNVHINTSAGTVLRIAQRFTMNDGSYFGPVCDVPVYVRADGATGNTTFAVTFGRTSEVHGQFFSLLGNLNLGYRTDLFGNFWAHNIASDVNVNVTGPPGSATSTTPFTPPTGAPR